MGVSMSNDSIEKVKNIIKQMDREGKVYVKSNQVADRLEDLNVRQTSHCLTAMENDGDLERWSDCTPMTWKITL
jgi:hypothetical protein